jgi:hypothetical protein
MKETPSVRRRARWPIYLAVLMLLCCGLSGYWYWEKILQPPRLTAVHSRELAPIISAFEAKLFSLDVQRQPNLILSVATKGYYQQSLQFHPSLDCPGCGQFPITIGADATQVCVLSYSNLQAVARATVRSRTVQVNSVTFKPVGPVSESVYRSTYHLMWQDKQWNIADVTGYAPIPGGEVDGIRVAQEYLDELGCR